MLRSEYRAQAAEAIEAAARPGVHVYDCETWLIKPGNVTPRLVCTAYLGPGMDSPALLDRADGLAWWKAITANDAAHHVGHNLKFDAIVLTNEYGALASVFDAWEDGRAWDTGIRARLVDLEIDGDLKRRRYSLAALESRYLGADRSASKKGPDAWRLRYAELDDVPVWEWPAAAVEYPLDDVRGTAALFDRLGGVAGVKGSESLKVCADLALGLTTAWGLRSDPEAVAALRATLETEIADLEVSLVGSGILRKTGSKDTKLLKSIVAETFDALGETCPTTDKGGVKTDRKTLERLVDHVPILATLVRRDLLAKRLNDYVAGAAEAALKYPVCPAYAVLKETGRTSSFRPNVQQIPKKGGIRECFVPRDGWVYLSCDYDSLEMRGWAEVCEEIVGHSVLAERYREDPDFDPHSYFAADAMGISYEDALERKAAKDPALVEARQGAKAANFGYPGGLGAETFIKYAANYGLDLDRDDALRLKDAWKSAWPEAGPYLKWISHRLGIADTTTIVQLRTSRVRAGCIYTQAANTLFQGLAADGANYATWLISRECYGAKPGPLTGARIVAFIHDEFLLEIPNPSGRLDGPEIVAGKRRLEELMIQGMETVVRNVPIRCEAVAARRWGKL